MQLPPKREPPAKEGKRGQREHRTSSRQTARILPRALTRGAGGRSTVGSPTESTRRKRWLSWAVVSRLSGKRFVSGACRVCAPNVAARHTTVSARCVRCTPHTHSVGSQCRRACRARAARRPTSSPGRNAFTSNGRVSDRAARSSGTPATSASLHAGNRRLRARGVRAAPVLPPQAGRRPEAADVGEAARSGTGGRGPSCEGV